MHVSPYVAQSYELNFLRHLVDNTIDRRAVYAIIYLYSKQNTEWKNNADVQSVRRMEVL